MKKDKKILLDKVIAFRVPYADYIKLKKIQKKNRLKNLYESIKFAITGGLL